MAFEKAFLTETIVLELVFRGDPWWFGEENMELRRKAWHGS